MKALLFRKINIEEKTYFQLFKIEDNFTNEDNYPKFSESNKIENDYYYLEIDDFIDDKYIMINSIYECTSDEMTELNDFDEIEKITKKFEEKYGTLDLTKQKIIENIKKDVLYQNEAIKQIIDTIYINEELNHSHINYNKLKDLHDNIILYGNPGNGKKTLIQSLLNNLKKPYAEVTITETPEKLAKDIASQLVDTTSTFTDLKNINDGLVIIHDNFDTLSKQVDIDQVYQMLKYLTKEVLIQTQKSKLSIDFSKITFILLKNNTNEIDDISEKSGFKKQIFIRPLNNTEIKNVFLNSKNSRLKIYKELFLKKGLKIKTQKNLLDYIINSLPQHENKMQVLNDILDHFVKDKWFNEKDIMITKDMVNEYLDTIYEPAEIIEEDKNDIQEITDKIKEKICSQDDQIHRIVFNILRNQKVAKNNIEDPKRYIKNMLIRGESGTGKTAIIREVARLMDIPMYIADATSYTESGFKGQDIDNMLVNLYREANGNLEKAQSGILVIDEIDKKSERGTDIDVSRGAVLNGLLKIIEGTKLPIKPSGEMGREIMFDTNKLTVICMGAFENIEKIRDSRLNVKKPVGFTNETETEIQNKEIIDEDYISYGMQRQFMARLGDLINLNKLSIEDLEFIMKNSKINELVIQKKLYSLDNIELEYDESFYHELAIKAYSKKCGARGIEKALLEVLQGIGADKVDSRKYKKIILSGNTVKDYNDVTLVEREKRLLK